MGIINDILARVRGGPATPVPAALDGTTRQAPVVQARVAAATGGAQWSRVDPVLDTLTAGRPGRSLRSYMASSNDRLVEDLREITGLVSGNSEVRMSLRAMRLRSRRLANDNEYVKRFLQLLRANVAGPQGFTLQSKIYRPRGRNPDTGRPALDRDANDTIEQAYRDHSRLGQFSACGRHSRASFERAAVTTLARDGEVIVEKLVGARYGRFGVQWRLIDSDLLDDELNVARGGAIAGVGRLEPGNCIRMGVECDDADRAVAYWFLSAHPSDDIAGSLVRRHRRVPADRIIHRFLVDDLRPGVTRGVPWIYAAMRRMAMLGGYEEAALVSARQGASKMGFYKQPAAGPGTPLDSNPDGSAVADEEDAAGNLVQESEPGVFGVLPPGWDFTTYDPAYPNDAMEGFIKAMLRAFASGVGLTYNTLASDLEGVSLSSMRHGANQDRDTYESLQAWVIEGLCQPMFEAWLEMGLTLGAIGRLPLEGFDRFNRPQFVPRRWRSPDPQKDIAASAQAVALAITSRTRVCAENGDDFEEILDELATEERMAKAAGVSLNTAAASATKTPRVDTAGATPSGQPAASADEVDDEGDDTPKQEDDDVPAQ